MRVCLHHHLCLALFLSSSPPLPLVLSVSPQSCLLDIPVCPVTRALVLSKQGDPLVGIVVSSPGRSKVVWGCCIHSNSYSCPLGVITRLYLLMIHPSMAVLVWHPCVVIMDFLVLPAVISACLALVVPCTPGRCTVKQGEMKQSESRHS